jgi:hypothetical protein
MVNEEKGYCGLSHRTLPSIVGVSRMPRHYHLSVLPNTLPQLYHPFLSQTRSRNKIMDVEISSNAESSPAAVSVTSGNMAATESPASTLSGPTIVNTPSTLASPEVTENKHDSSSVQRVKLKRNRLVLYVSFLSAHFQSEWERC